MKLKLILVIIILINTIKLLTCNTITVNGHCGDPGIPTRSDLSPKKLIYDEDEAIVYKCNDYISLQQHRKCVKGKWTGKIAVCGRALGDNDLQLAKIYDKTNEQLIRIYNTSVLDTWIKFNNSFIAERYKQPLRAFGAKSYRLELYMKSNAIFQLVRISLSVVNHSISNQIKESKFNITKVTVSPYRECALNTHSFIKGWLHNSTRYDYWFSCESRDEQSFQKELQNKSNLVIIETQSDSAMSVDLATFILAEQYTNNGNPYEPICGLPGNPIGLNQLVVNHFTKYTFKCADGFASLGSGDEDNAIYELVCSTDMKWRGTLPECLPRKTCKKFDPNVKLLTEVYMYNEVYYYNTSVWFAIEGTKAYFRCRNALQIFVGKDFRVCGKDGEWSANVPNCLDSNQESKQTDITIISIIIMLTLILTFGLSAIFVCCYMRIKKMHSKRVNPNCLRQSNIYDDYSFHEMAPEGKNVDEVYEMVEDNRYDYNRYATPNQNLQSAYTPMTGPYKPKYNDKNVYDDCIDYEPQQQYSTLNPIHIEDSYVVMKVK